MAEADKRPIGQWTADEAAREEAATSARIEREPPARRGAERARGRGARTVREPRR